jgi:hypothetical protein
MKKDDSISVNALYYPNGNRYKFKVKSVDSVLFEGKKLKRLRMEYTFYASSSPFKMDWIEGVGSNEHPIYPLVAITSHALDGAKFYTSVPIITTLWYIVKTNFQLALPTYLIPLFFHYLKMLHAGTLGNIQLFTRHLVLKQPKKLSIIKILLFAQNSIPK